MWWKAWYELEPRGEERGDWQTAIATLPHIKEGSTIADVLRILKDCWHPVTREEKERRKEEKKRRARQKMNAYSRGCAKFLKDQEREKKCGGLERRKMVDSDGD